MSNDRWAAGWSVGGIYIPLLGMFERRVGTNYGDIVREWVGRKHPNIWLHRNCKGGLYVGRKEQG